MHVFLSELSFSLEDANQQEFGSVIDVQPSSSPTSLSTLPSTAGKGRSQGRGKVKRSNPPHKQPAVGSLATGASMHSTPTAIINPCLPSLDDSQEASMPPLEHHKTHSPCKSFCISIDRNIMIYDIAGY